MSSMKKLSLVLIILALFQGCAQKTVWFRGNTHAHTVICGHADSSPEVVTQWYHDHGYNFLVLSEHNHFIDPDSVTLPDELRDDFILIPGEEVSGPKVVHSTALNIDNLVTSDQSLEVKSHIIQNHVDVTLAAQGKTILNHPNYQYAVSAADILEVKGLYMFELYNGHPYVDNEGDRDHPSTEAMWDELLTKGMAIYGTSSDDAHHFKTLDAEHSNPGRGWVMVKSKELTGDAIAQAMNTGAFYASNGVVLKECTVTNKSYQVEVDPRQTMLTIDDPDLKGKLDTGLKPGFLIEFVGPYGKVIYASRKQQATYNLKNAPNYVRARVSYTRDDTRRGQETFFAWGQPAFTDGRLD